MRQIKYDIVYVFIDFNIGVFCFLVFKCQAFSEGAVSTFDHSLKEKAPFTLSNSLGIPLSIQHSANLRLADSPSQSKVHEVGLGTCLDLEYSVFKFTSREKLSTLQRQESCLFNLSMGIHFIILKYLLRKTLFLLYN